MPNCCTCPIQTIRTSLKTVLSIPLQITPFLNLEMHFWPRDYNSISRPHQISFSTRWDEKNVLLNDSKQYFELLCIPVFSQRFFSSQSTYQTYSQTNITMKNRRFVPGIRTHVLWRESVMMHKHRSISNCQCKQQSKKKKYV